MNGLYQRTLVTRALAGALTEIRPSNGYSTPIGENLYVARENLEEAEIPCCILIPSTDSLGPDAGPNGHVQIRYRISGFVNLRDSLYAAYVELQGAEYAIVDAIIGDLRRALEGPCAFGDVADDILYAGAQPFYHQRGGESCGVMLDYLITTPRVEYLPGQ